MVTCRPSYELEVFFDGDCPICRREIACLRRLDRRRGRIRFTDISHPEFQPEDCGIGLEQLMAEIHARRPDGTWTRGAEVFRRLYAAVGFGPLVRLTRFPGITQLLDAAYAIFARNRLRWTNRCDAACRLETPQ